MKTAEKTKNPLLGEASERSQVIEKDTEPKISVQCYRRSDHELLLQCPLLSCIQNPEFGTCNQSYTCHRRCNRSKATILASSSLLSSSSIVPNHSHYPGTNSRSNVLLMTIVLLITLFPLVARSISLIGSHSRPISSSLLEFHESSKRPSIGLLNLAGQSKGLTSLTSVIAEPGPLKQTNRTSNIVTEGQTNRPLEASSISNSDFDRAKRAFNHRRIVTGSERDWQRLTRAPTGTATEAQLEANAGTRIEASTKRNTATITPMTPSVGSVNLTIVNMNDRESELKFSVSQSSDRDEAIESGYDMDEHEQEELLGSSIRMRIRRSDIENLSSIPMNSAQTSSLTAISQLSSESQVPAGDSSLLEPSDPLITKGAENLNQGNDTQKLMEFRQKFFLNRAISDRAYYSFLLVYSLFIFVGTISNSLICLTVILRPRILSPRNIFIVNLAGSDLLLCVFTMPFSFIQITSKLWPMGELPCKLVAGLQGTSIFVSTISITAIALDRYLVIVYPTHRGNSSRGNFLALRWLLIVWCFALVLSSPLFYYRRLEGVHMPEYISILLNHQTMAYCVEYWPIAHGRGIYSVISMIFQYLVPITIVSIVYLRISDKLQKRLIRRQKLTQLECQQKRQLDSIRKTHTMLIMVSLLFGLCWLPLNLLNIINDISDLFGDDDYLFRLAFGVCHLIGCSSACSNPILYGFMNDNFRKELQQVYLHYWHYWSRMMPRFCLFGSRSSGQTSTSSTTGTSTTETTSSTNGNSSQSNTNLSGSQYTGTPIGSLSSNSGNPSKCTSRNGSGQGELDGQIVILMTENPNSSSRTKGKGKGKNQQQQQQQPSSLLVDGNDRLHTPITRIIGSPNGSGVDNMWTNNSTSNAEGSGFFVKLGRILGCPVPLMPLSIPSELSRTNSQRKTKEDGFSQTDVTKATNNEKCFDTNSTERRKCQAKLKRKDQRKGKRRCQCHCHQNDHRVGSDITGFKRTRSTGARVCSQSNDSSAPIKGKRRLSSGDFYTMQSAYVTSKSESSKDGQPKCLSQTPIGRRVWLRFLPSKQRSISSRKQNHSQDLNSSFKSKGKREKKRRHCSICRASAERLAKERRERRLTSRSRKKQTNSIEEPKSGSFVPADLNKRNFFEGSISHSIGSKKEECASSCLTQRLCSSSMMASAAIALPIIDDNSKPTNLNNSNKVNRNRTSESDVGPKTIPEANENYIRSPPASPTSMLSSTCLNSSISSSICSCVRGSSLDCAGGENMQNSNNGCKINGKTTSLCIETHSVGAPEQDRNTEPIYADYIRRRCNTTGPGRADNVRLAKVAATERRCCKMRSQDSTNCCFGSTFSSITTATDNQSSEYICSLASNSASSRSSSTASDSSLPLRNDSGSSKLVVKQICGEKISPD